jgi:ATP adenylyltransferase
MSHKKHHEGVAIIPTLWAPWRLDYIKSVADGPTECFLCDNAKQPDRDREHLVLHRGAFGMLLMNKYPYVNGHLLVASYLHGSDLLHLPTDVRAELLELVALGQQLLTQVVNPQGFNVGINQGRCAGAGVPGHLHLHIVPRWNGDVNFMSVVGGVRVIPQAVEVTYAALWAEMEKLNAKGG